MSFPSSCKPWTKEQRWRLLRRCVYANYTGGITVWGVRMGADILSGIMAFVVHHIPGLGSRTLSNALCRHTLYPLLGRLIIRQVVIAAILLELPVNSDFLFITKCYKGISLNCTWMKKFAVYFDNLTAPHSLKCVAHFYFGCSTLSSRLNSLKGFLVVLVIFSSPFASYVHCQKVMAFPVIVNFLAELLKKGG